MSYRKTLRFEICSLIVVWDLCNCHMYWLEKSLQPWIWRFSHLKLICANKFQVIEFYIVVLDLERWNSEANRGRRIRYWQISLSPWKELFVSNISRRSVKWLCWFLHAHLRVSSILHIWSISSFLVPVRASAAPPVSCSRINARTQQKGKNNSSE